MAARQQWFDTLRLRIRQEHGMGWSVREVGVKKRNPIGRCQLTRIWENRTRCSAVLPLEWKATNATAILSTTMRTAPRSAWIVELLASGSRDGKPFKARHLYGLRPTASTSPACAPPQKPYCD